MHLECSCMCMLHYNYVALKCFIMFYATLVWFTNINIFISCCMALQRAQLERVRIYVIFTVHLIFKQNKQQSECMSKYYTHNLTLMLVHIKKQYYTQLCFWHGRKIFVSLFSLRSLLNQIINMNVWRVFHSFNVSIKC